MEKLFSKMTGLKKILFQDALMLAITMSSYIIVYSLSSHKEAACTIAAIIIFLAFAQIAGNAVGTNKFSHIYFAITMIAFALAVTSTLIAIILALDYAIDVAAIFGAIAVIANAKNTAEKYGSKHWKVCLFSLAQAALVMVSLAFQTPHGAVAVLSLNTIIVIWLLSEAKIRQSNI